MNTETRKLVPLVAIGLAVVIGGYKALVDPAREKARVLAAEISETSARVAGAESFLDQIPAMTAEIAALEARAGSIAATSGIARHSIGLYEAVTRIGASCRVRINQLDPTAPVVAAPGAPNAPPSRDTQVGYQIIVQGSYADVVRFVGALGRDLGYTLVRSVRISPDRDSAQPMVTASIQTEHYGFDTAPPPPPPTAP